VLTEADQRRIAELSDVLEIGIDDVVRRALDALEDQILSQQFTLAGQSQEVGGG